MEDSQEKDYSFLGNDTFPNLYDALVNERKFKSEYLERQIYERLLKSEPSIVKLMVMDDQDNKLSVKMGDQVLGQLVDNILNQDEQTLAQNLLFVENVSITYKKDTLIVSKIN